MTASGSIILTHRIPPQQGFGLLLKRGQTLRVISPQNEQVADLAAFSAIDKREWLSSGRTIDYASSIFVTTGSVLYSNRSSPMFTIVADSVGRHDFLLTPCSQEMFRKLYGVTGHHPSCFENLATALAPFRIEADAVPTTLSLFMHVDVDGKSGRVTVLPPSSRAGDYIEMRAEMDLIVGLTSCAAELSNNGSFKPIDVMVSSTTEKKTSR